MCQVLAGGWEREDLVAQAMIRPTLPDIREGDVLQRPDRMHRANAGSTNVIPITRNLDQPLHHPGQRRELSQGLLPRSSLPDHHKR